jgi:hypothetical protein
MLFGSTSEDDEMGGMTRQSLENLKVADAAKYHEAPSGGWIVAAELQGNRAYVSDDEGPIAYPTPTLARLAIQSVRPDLEPKEI